MEELKSVDSKAYDWLRKIPPSSLSRSHFSGRAKCDILLNNLCESFNSKLVDDRDQPIIGCLQYIREYSMKRIVSVQEVIDRTEGPLTPTANAILRNIKQEENDYTVIWNRGTHIV